MKEEQIKVLEFKIGKFHLGDNDYLVVRFPEDYPKEELNEVASWFFIKFPELAKKTLILSGDIKIYIAHVEDKNEK